MIARPIPLRLWPGDGTRSPAGAGRQAPRGREGGRVFSRPDHPQPQGKDERFHRTLAVKRAGIRDLHLHGLRHTFASRLAMAGVDL